MSDIYVCMCVCVCVCVCVYIYIYIYIVCTPAIQSDTKVTWHGMFKRTAVSRDFCTTLYFLNALFCGLTNIIHWTGLSFIVDANLVLGKINLMFIVSLSHYLPFFSSLLLLLLLTLLSVIFCRLFTIISLKQTVCLGYTVLQLFCAHKWWHL